MAETTYTYSISSDTANGKVAGDRLSKEIQDSSIVVALERIDTLGDVLDIIFKDVLLSGDSVTLDSIVSSHTGVFIEVARPVRIQETNVSERQLVVKGIRFLATLNTTTDNDTTFPEDRELQGVEAFVWNHTDGDYMEMFAVHPTEGVLTQFGETVYVPPDGNIKHPPSFDTSSVPSGIIIRIAYTSIGTTGDQPVIIAHYRTHK